MPPSGNDAAAHTYAEALRDTTLRYERLMQGLSILRQMDKLDDPLSDLDETCSRILETISSELAAENCSLFLMNEAGDALELRAACSPFEEHCKYFGENDAPGTRFLLGEGIVGEVGQKREALRIEDTKGDERFINTPRAVQVRSLLCFPLLVGDQLVGVLNLSHSEPGFFTAQTENALSFIAERVARIFAYHILSERLRQSEEHYRLVAENAGDGILVFDKGGRLIDANPTIERITGVSVNSLVAGEMDWLAGIHPEDRENYAAHHDRLAASNRPETIAYRYLAADGRVQFLEQRTAPLRDESGEARSFVAVVRDITERKHAEDERRELEAQIQHVQKLESLGVLAGGIAHDFNNLLAGVMGNAGLAMTKVPEDSPAYRYLEKIETTARRAADLTRELLAYSGKGTFVIEPLDLAGQVREIGHLLDASVSKRTTLQFEFEPDLPPVKGDAPQLQQVIMNLITNAADAIGEGGGTITLRLKAMDIDRDYLALTYLHKELEPGPHVCLEVSDTGCGMPADTQRRIFDPFFSTKFAGRGLGLAAVLGIVHGHSGAIKVYSEPGRGTTFKVFLPAQKKGVRRQTAEGHAWQAELSAWQTQGAVLVVDDEPNVVEVAKATLEQHGLTVLTAQNGQEALEVLKEHRKELRAVFLDLVMPVMDGKETYERIQEITPDVPVVVSSGYTEDDVIGRFADKGPSAFLQKPFMPEELASKFRDVLS